MITPKKQFWVSNITNRDIGLGDLRTTIKAHTIVNLLDRKHYQYTEANLELSRKSGSLLKHRKALIIRQVEPQPAVPPGIYKTEGVPTTLRIRRPIIKTIVPEYEELQFDDEKFAADETLDTNEPIIPKK